MPTLLQINTSIFQDDGASSRLASRFAEAWRASYPDGEIILRDLGTHPVPHLTAERFQALIAKPAARTAAQQAVADYSDALIDELRRADVVVLGLPMYNFGVPSALKAYFDHIARAGVTFRYTDRGAEGLLAGKNAYVFTARGGLYAGTPADTQTPYVRDFLAFLGIADVEFVHAEGLAMGESSKQKSLQDAHAAIARMADREASSVALAA